MPSPLSNSLWRHLWWVPMITLVLVRPLPGQPRHDLYICVSMSTAFVIGSPLTLPNGLYRSTDRQEITHLGFNHPRQDAVSADPRDPAVLYTAGLNGVMRTTDGGRTWRIMTSWDMTEPKDIEVDPHQPDRIFIALPDGIGVSTDRGQTWHRRQEGIRRRYTQSILVDRATPGRLLAATELGLYLTENDARHWTLVLPTEATVTDVQQSPHDPLRFLAVTQRDGAWESTDGGRTWQALRGLPRGTTLHNVAFDPTEAQRAAISGWEVGVRVTEDGGRTWHDRTAGLPTTHAARVAIDPDRPGRIYASIHGAPIFRSDDFGRTWQRQWFEGATVWSFTFVARR